MAYLSQRFLIVFNNHQDDVDTQVKILHYQAMIQHSRALKTNKIEYFLLYVASHIPSYALQSPTMLQFTIKETNRNKIVLANLGRKLAIKPENQFLAEGSIDLQAWQLAQQLKVDKVFGYSKIFNKFLNICRTAKFTWSHMFLLKKKGNINRIH